MPFDRKAYMREYNKKYREKNRDKLVAHSKAYFESHREENTARCKKRYRDNKAEYAESGRKRHLKKKYDITDADFSAMLSKQDGKCAVCRTDTPGGRFGKWNIDHCHDSGKVRGLLCWACNTGLGKFKDNEDFLASAIQYLRTNKCS